MSSTVRDIMNPQLLYVEEDDPAELVHAKILTFGVGGAPVLDRSYRPTGFVSLRDFSTDGKTMRVSRPVVTAQLAESVEAAAARLVRHGLRHLVVVDEHGIARGMVSALDFVRAFVGLEPRHPRKFDVECTSAAAFTDDLG